MLLKLGQPSHLSPYLVKTTTTYFSIVYYCKIGIIRSFSKILNQIQRNRILFNLNVCINLKYKIEIIRKRKILKHYMKPFLPNILLLFLIPYSIILYGKKLIRNVYYDIEGLIMILQYNYLNNMCSPTLFRYL